MSRAVAAEERLSFRPEDATEGGGTEGARAVISEIEFVDEFTYGGRIAKPVAALRVLFTIDGFDKPWEQHYSVGPSSNFEVVGNGNFIKSLGKQKGFNKNSIAYKFLSSAISADSDMLDELEGQGVAALEDKAVRLTNGEYEAVNGDKKQAILIASFEEDEPVVVKGKSKVSVNSVSDKTDAVIQSLLAGTPKIKRGELSNKVFEANKKDADVKAMMQLCFKDSWLGDDARPFTWDRKKNVIVAKDED